MGKLTKKFSIDDVKMYRDDEDMDFAEVEIWALASGSNSHNNPFSEEVLERDANTFKGKFLIAKYDKFQQDVTSHVPNQSILGYVDPTKEIEFKTKNVDGIDKEFVVVHGLLSKVYATDVVEMFRLNNKRTVSCEFSCSTKYDEDETGSPIDDNGQRMFGVDNPVLSYHIHGITILGLKYNPSVKGTEMKVKRFARFSSDFGTDCFSLKNFDSERKERLTNKVNDIKDNKEEIMEDEKKLESKTEDTSIVMSEDDKKQEESKVEDEKEKEMSTEQPQVDKAEGEDKPEKEMAEKEQPKAESEEKEMGCDKEMAEKDKEEKVEEKEKKFSLSQFSNATFESESDSVKAFVQKVMSEMNANEIVNELVRLKKFEESRLAQDKETKLNQIMASVKCDLDTKTFSELQVEGKSLSLSELNGFENKVKAFAYEATKGKEDHTDGFLRMASNEELMEQKAVLTADDIYKKYL